MTFIVAEIGINHNGSLDIAKKLIDIAVSAGCDAVKFQKRTVEKVYSKKVLDSARERNAAISFIEQINKNHLLLNIGFGMNEASVITRMGGNNYIGTDYSFSAAKYSHSSIKKTK